MVLRNLKCINNINIIYIICLKWHRKHSILEAKINLIYTITEICKPYSMHLNLLDREIQHEKMFVCRMRSCACLCVHWLVSLCV